MVLEKLGRYMQKNETRLHSYTTHKNKFKMDQNCGSVEGLNKKEKGLMDMDNSVVIAGGREV